MNPDYVLSGKACPREGMMGPPKPGQFAGTWADPLSAGLGILTQGSAVTWEGTA